MDTLFLRQSLGCVVPFNAVCMGSGHNNYEFNNYFYKKNKCIKK